VRAASSKKDSAIIEVESDTIDMTIDLTNVHAAVRELRTDLKRAAIVEFLEGLLEEAGALRTRPTDTDSWSEMSRLLRPRLVSPDMRPTLPGALLRSLAPGACVAYVLDHGRRVQYVMRDQLASWGVDIHRIDEIAVANLEVLSDGVSLEVREEEGGGLFAMVATDDSYDAARLVLPRFRERLMVKLGEPIFVGIPNRDLLAAWSPNHEQFAELVALTAKYATETPYPITDTIFRVDRQQVRPATAAELRRG